MSNFDLRTPEDEKDIKSLRQGVLLGVVLTVKHSHLVLMLSKPKECAFRVLMAGQLQSH